MNDDRTKKAAIAAGRESAHKVLKWLDDGGRNQVQAAVQKAVDQTEARNKARELDADFLERRVTF